MNDYYDYYEYSDGIYKRIDYYAICVPKRYTRIRDAENSFEM